MGDSFNSKGNKLSLGIFAVLTESEILFSTTSDSFESLLKKKTKLINTKKAPANKTAFCLFLMIKSNLFFTFIKFNTLSLFFIIKLNLFLRFLKSFCLFFIIRLNFFLGP